MHIALLVAALVGDVAYPCDNDVADYVSLLGVSDDLSRFVLRVRRDVRDDLSRFVIRVRRGGAYGEALLLCRTGARCKGFVIADFTDGTRPSSTGEPEQASRRSAAETAINAAKIQLPLTEPKESYEDEEPEVPDRVAKRAGLAPPVSFIEGGGSIPQDRGSLTLSFGAGEEHTIHRSQFALSDMGYFPIGVWVLLSADGRLVVYGGYGDTSCYREPKVNSARFRKLATQALNGAGLKAFSGGRLNKAKKFFRQATTRAPGYRSAWLNRMFAALVRGDKSGASVALEEFRDLPTPKARHPATVCSWPERAKTARARRLCVLRG